MPRDYYEVLGVDRGASERARSRRRSARSRASCTPTSTPPTPTPRSSFKEAAEAYEVLSDPERRRTYDAFGHDGLRTGGWSPRIGRRRRRSRTSSRPSSAAATRSSASCSASGARARRPAATSAREVEISLAEVVTGATREVSFDAVSACEHCRGNGAEPGTPIRTCDDCGGAGQVRQVTPARRSASSSAPAPATCGGDGRDRRAALRGVRRAGAAWPARGPGTSTSRPGSSRASGSGSPAPATPARPAAGRATSTSRSSVADDERFRREGADLVSVVDVPATAAMLGQPRDRRDARRRAGGRGPGRDPARRPRRRCAGSACRSCAAGAAATSTSSSTSSSPASLSDEQRELAERLDESVGPENLRGDQGKGLFARVRRALR